MLPAYMWKEKAKREGEKSKEGRKERGRKNIEKIST